MSSYYVSLLASPNGNHEVHKGDCNHFPDFEDTLSLGSYNHVAFAIEEAKRIFPNSTACHVCLNDKKLGSVA